MDHIGALQYSNGEQLEWHCDMPLLVMETLGCGAVSRRKYAKSCIPDMDSAHNLIFRRVQSVGSCREILEKEKVMGAGELRAGLGSELLTDVMMCYENKNYNMKLMRSSSIEKHFRYRSGTISDIALEINNCYNEKQF